MPFISGTFCERATVLDKLDPVSQAAATVTGAAVDMLYYSRVMYLVQVGSVGGSGTVDFKLQGSKDGSTNWTDISGKSITQITASNKVAKVGITAEDLGTSTGANGPYRYVRGSLTVGTNAVLIGMLALGTDGRFRPENKFNEIAGVTQTVNDAS